MKKYIVSTVFVISLILPSLPLQSAEGWQWNPSNLLKPPVWITKPVTATSNAIVKTTKSTWKTISKGTATAWKKTTDVLDPFPDSPPAGSQDKPQTVSEFFSQQRPQ